MLSNANELIKDVNRVESIQTVILVGRQIEEFENQIRNDIYGATSGEDEPIERSRW